MIYADSSFIVSAYLADSGTADALAYLDKHEPRLPFVFLHWPEVAGTFFKHHANAEKLWDLLREDIADGTKLHPVALDADRVARRAAGLMMNYSRRWPKIRALDTMHVAAAVENGDKKFLSFDSTSCQRILAHSQKLEVWPPLTEEEKARLK